VSLLDEYRAGDHAGVWARLVAAGPALREDPDAWRDARAVARETMRRARANAERLHDALRADGYAFAADAPLRDPEPDAAARLDAVEARIGPLPLSLRAWLEEVGAVDLNGRHPDWPEVMTDALVVDPAPGGGSPSEAILAEHDERGGGPFPLPLAPDYLHKAGISGGEPYATWLPDAAADARWHGDDLHRGTFVEYLRSAFAACGFPGFARHPEVTAPSLPVRLDPL
jgi:hypothetical protein